MTDQYVIILFQKCFLLLFFYILPDYIKIILSIQKIKTNLKYQIAYHYLLYANCIINTYFII